MSFLHSATDPGKSLRSARISKDGFFHSLWKHDSFFGVSLTAQPLLKDARLREVNEKVD
jgi:hypothetical protein